MSESLSSRAALPSIPQNDLAPEENLLWQFTFTNQASSQELFFNSQDLQKNDNGFLIPLPQGDWSIQVTSTYFEGYLENLQINDTGFYNIELPVYFTGDGNGTLSLKINAGDSGITKVFVKNQSKSADDNYPNQNLEDFYYCDDSNIITLYKENLPSGTFKVILYFFIEDMCILALPETINIRKNSITSKWSEDLGITCITSKEDETLDISKELIRSIRGNMFYVKDIINPNIISDGSAYSPFSSIQQAIDFISYLNNEESNYILFIDGLFENNHFQASTAFVTITSDKKLSLTLKGLSPAATINAAGNENNKCRVMEISGNVQLEIVDLTVTGGYSEQNGAGIYISTPINNNPNLILSGSTKITGNYTSDSGGGLYIDEGAVCIKDDTEITSNTALTKGGGICILGKSGKDKRTLDMQGGTITNNTALSKNKNTGAGGGLYTQFAIIHLDNCLLSQNQAANGGGIGIAQNSNIFITNTIITENTAVYGASSSKGGGGIFASGVSANLYLQEGTVITNNHTNSETSKGGGISITTTNVHISSKVNISENYYTPSSSGQNLQSNISLASSKILTIDQALENVVIGITTADSPTEESPVIFTHNYSKYNGNINPGQFFFSDNSFFTVSTGEQGEACINTF